MRSSLFDRIMMIHTRIARVRYHERALDGKRARGTFFFYDGMGQWEASSTKHSGEA
jgi:hypothetical protein